MKKFLLSELKSDISLARSLLGTKITPEQNLQLLHDLAPNPLDPFQLSQLNLE
jgi:hypothetical protein